MTLVNLPKDANVTGVANWSDIYDNDAAVVAVVNGDIRDDNLSGAAAISRSKLAALTTTHKEASGDLVTAAGYQDIPGLTYTTTATGTYLVNATVLFGFAADATGLAQLLVNGVAQTVKAKAVLGTGVGASDIPASASWVVTATAGQIIKVQGAKVGGNAVTALTAYSHMVAVQVG